MKRQIKNLISLAVLCALLLCLFTGTAFAGSTNDTLNAEINVNCMKYSGDDSGKYIVKIESTDASCPAPKEDSLNIKEDGTGSFVISVDEPGTYDYLVYQEAGDDEKTTYDDTVYHVKVFVTQNDAMDLEFFVSATVGDSGEKPDTVHFMNEKKTDMDESSGSRKPPVKTGDESNIPALAVLAGVMVVVFVILLITGKKNNDNDDDDKDDKE